MYIPKNGLQNISESLKVQSFLGKHVATQIPSLPDVLSLPLCIIIFESSHFMPTGNNKTVHFPMYDIVFEVMIIWIITCKLRGFHSLKENSPIYRF